MENNTDFRKAIKVYSEERGHFIETYSRQGFAAGGITYDFIQDNQSSFTMGAFHGLRFQLGHSQAKLTRVTKGEVFDLAVDLRIMTQTYGTWIGIVLSADNRRQHFLSRHFAYSFLILGDTAEFCYKCDGVYRPNYESGIMRNGTTTDIKWPLNHKTKPIVSEKLRTIQLLKLS